MKKREILLDGKNGIWIFPNIFKLQKIIRQRVIEITCGEGVDDDVLGRGN